MPQASAIGLEQSPNRLLVEGRDDQWSIISLVARHGANWDAYSPAGLPYIHDSGGCESLIASIPASSKSFQRLGIVIDADSSAAEKWTRVRNALAKSDIATPNTAEVGGTIVPGITPERRIGVWLMPDNKNAGRLEDFLARLIPSDDRCWPFTIEVVAGARQRGAQVSSNDEMKARIYSWLAWRRDPGRPLGTAITAAYFRDDSVEALAFIQWFHNLFTR
jgi:hypothetical protein